MGEASSVEITEDIITQMKRIQVIKAEYSASNTYNIDKTGFLWKRLPNLGLITTSASKRVDKTYIIANLYCNKDGSDKLLL